MQMGKGRAVNIIWGQCGTVIETGVRIRRKRRTSIGHQINLIPKIGCHPRSRGHAMRRRQPADCQFGRADDFQMGMEACSYKRRIHRFLENRLTVLGSDLIFELCPRSGQRGAFFDTDMLNVNDRLAYGTPVLQQIARAILGLRIVPRAPFWVIEPFLDID